MAGNRVIRGRAPALALAVAACASLSVAGGAQGAVRPAPGSPSGDPPTWAEVRRATERFLADSPPPETIPRARGSGGTGPIPAEGSIFPETRLVSFYGAPQLGRTIVGRKTPDGAATKLQRQAAAYEGEGVRPVIPAFDLIAVIANSTRGPDRKYRTRQDPAIIDTYLAQAREIGARLMLDIQPGRANVLAELRALEPYLLQPDVDVSIDPEWNVGHHGIPGRTRGSIKAGRLNKVSAFLQRLVDANALPAKVLVVHQFERRGIRHRNRLVGREDVEVTINFDGIGGRGSKKAGYARFSLKRLFNGFSLFYLLDRNLMRPRGVVRLEPEPDFVLYQ